MHHILVLPRRRRQDGGSSSTHEGVRIGVEVNRGKKTIEGVHHEGARNAEEAERARESPEPT
jgi:hypothetical protein